uniref:Cadherin domain-containing protein n=1 Tax=Denticeps clupeoides TaxID=299321 RepID=A0AAY4BD24_9TELE
MALSGVTGPCRFWMLLLLLLELRDVSSGHVVYSVSEEARRGTVVGNVAKDLNIGVKDLESRSFQIVSGTSKKYFAVNLQTGVLFVDERIDREEICGSSSKCAVKLEALVQHPHSLYRMQINILDINDNNPTFHVSIFYINITENASPGERFPLPIAEDIDVGVNSLKSYMLSSSEDFTLDVQKEGDQIVSAELVLQKHLDREKQVFSCLYNIFFITGFCTRGVDRERCESAFGLRHCCLSLIKVQYNTDMSTRQEKGTQTGI